MSLQRDVVEHSIEAFTKEVVLLVKDGWAISPTNPGDAVGFGNTYTVSMYRDDTTVQSLKDVVSSMSTEPKMTRAESLQKARDSRKGGKLDVTKITSQEETN